MSVGVGAPYKPGPDFTWFSGSIIRLVNPSARQQLGGSVAAHALLFFYIHQHPSKENKTYIHIIIISVLQQVLFFAPTSPKLAQDPGLLRNYQPNPRTPIRYEGTNVHDVDYSALPSTSQEPSQPPDNMTRGERALPRREGDDTVRVQAQKEEEVPVSLYAFCSSERKTTFDPSEEEQCFIAFDGENVADTKETNNEKSMYYDCYAVSTATHHITSRRDAFLTYQLTHDTLIEGIGGTISRAEGRGTIELESQYGGKKYVLRLLDVLYIPGNMYNIFSLGRWTDTGGEVIFKNGTVSLITESKKCAAQGTRMKNNLYKMRFTIRKPTVATMHSWETWHKRYGHIGYAGLQKLLDNRLVEDFAVDIPTTKSPCIACSEGKQSESIFGAVPNRKTTAGEITHMGLWGKYEVTSVNGHQYYILFIDEWTRYITVEFLESKSQVTEKVKKYALYLKTHDKKLRAIRVSGENDIITSELRAWCAGRGICMQMTARNSPLQNRDGVLAEQMNRTLVGLARTMLTAKGLPEFLWEPAVAHAAYLTNRAYSRTREDPTSYEKWNNTRPNVSNLREFGAPVWIVLQREEQKVRRELLPLAKGRGRAFVGYDETEGSKSVQYYDADTKKVLTSTNFRLITLPENDYQVEGIAVVAPDTTTHGGELVAEGSRRATCGEARDGARADTGTGNVHGNRSLKNGAPNRLKREAPEDLDVGERAGPAAARVKVRKH